MLFYWKTTSRHLWFNEYELVSGKESGAFDPLEWNVYGMDTYDKDHPDEWVLIHSVYRETSFEERQVAYKYDVRSNHHFFTHLKFEFCMLLSDKLML